MILNNSFYKNRYYIEVKWNRKKTNSYYYKKLLNIYSKKLSYFNFNFMKFIIRKTKKVLEIKISPKIIIFY